MPRHLKTGLCAAILLFSAASLMAAEPEQKQQGREKDNAASAPTRTQQPRGEPHPAPRGYTRPAQPQVARPETADRPTLQHNYQAQRSYKIGPYRRPQGWIARRWAYGQILPRVYWGAQYLIADYWLFGLEVPPVGYEWVRDDSDALLVDTSSGEILQVEYGVFS